MTTMPEKRFNRICLVTVVLVLLASAYWAFNRVHTLRNQYRIEKDVISEKLNEVNLARTNLKDLKDVLQETSAQLAYLNERIPETGKIGELLQQFDFLMRRHNIRLIGIHPLPVVEEKMYLRNPIRLVFSGRFVDVFNLLSDIESMNRIVVMDHVTIARQEARKPCTVDLVACVYERKKSGRLSLDG